MPKTKITPWYQPIADYNEFGHRAIYSQHDEYAYYQPHSPRALHQLEGIKACHNLTPSQYFHLEEQQWRQMSWKTKNYYYAIDDWANYRDVFPPKRKVQENYKI